MELIRRLYGQFDNCIHDIERQTAAFSAFFSGVVAVLISMCYFVIGQNGKEKYTDIVSDYLAIDGAYKGVDVNTFYILIFSFIILFFAIYSCLKKRNLKVNVRTNSYWYAFAIIPITLYLVISRNIMAELFMVMIASYYICLNKKPGEKEKNLRNGIFTYIYIYMGLTGIEALIQFSGLADISAYSNWVMVLTLSMWTGFTYFNIKFNYKLEKYFSYLQVIIPCNILGIINTRYLYQGEQIRPDALEPINKFIVSIWLIMETICLGLIIRERWKKNEITLQLTTVVSMLMIIVWNCNYNLLVNTDTFHMGETAIVYNQVVNLGQRWGADFSSIMQGMGLLLSGINEWLFDGNFAMYMQSINILLLCFAILLGIVTHRYAKDSAWFFLYLAFIPALLMDRTYLVVITFLILINKKLLKNIYLWTYVFLLLCVVNVFYQPTYGGAVCTSLLIPFVVMWRTVLTRSGQKFSHFFMKRRQFFFLISIVMIGILCIPLLYYAIGFLAENGKSTVTANGITILQSAKYFPTKSSTFQNKYLEALIIYLIRYALGPLVLMSLFYYFIVYQNRISDYITRMQLLILSVSGGISYILMLTATFNRIDAGLSRIGNVNCIYTSLLVVFILLIWDKLENKMIPGMLVGIVCFCGMYAGGFQLFDINEKVCTVVEIPDEALYVKEEEHGLSNLGDVFTDDESYMYEAKIVNEICLKLLNENQTYYDCLDKSIYYNFANRKVPGYHVAQYTLGGSTDLQEKAIQNMEKQDVPIIFIKGIKSNSYISKRCYLMYRYLIHLDYRLIQYKGCYFLVNREIDLTPIRTEIIDMQWQWLTGSNEFVNCIDRLRKEATVIGKGKELENISGTDLLLIRFNNIEELVGVINAELDGRWVSLEVNIGKNGELVLPAFLAKKISVTLSKNLEDCVQEVALYDLTETDEIHLNENVQNILKKAELDKLNQAFRTSSIGYAAEEWGNNFDNMKEKFTYVCDLTKSIDESQTSGFLVSGMSGLSGEDADFLYLQLENERADIVATIITSGIDRNGNEFSERLDIALKYNDSSLLIPIGSSPKVLTANEIKSIEILFSTCDIGVDKACLYAFK